MTRAPICLFVYNRPEHTARTIQALQANLLATESDLVIFSDAPKDAAASENVARVRSLIHTVAGFKSVQIVERSENLGLAASIMDGVTSVVEHYGRVIVLEDDIVTSPYFLNFMNDALAMYEHDEQVMHVSGYFFPVSAQLPDTFFYSQTSCWGWATWARAWKHFNPNADALLKEIRARHGEYSFTIDGSHNSFIEQLEGNVSGILSTWAIKWQASVFLLNGLSLHPRHSFVQNIGNDGSGVHSGSSTAYDTVLADSYTPLVRIPLVESPEVRAAMKVFYAHIVPSFPVRVLRKIRSMMFSV